MFPIIKNYYLAINLIKSNQPMISTLKKIELKGANRIGVCFPCSNVQNLRHSFAARLIEVGTDNPPHPALPDQLSIKTTMIYSHISGKTVNWIQSSLDRLNVQAEDKNDEKMTKMYNNFGVLTNCVLC